MAKFARLSKAGKPPEIYPVVRPFSFFDFREKHFGELEPLARLFSQARFFGAVTMVVESLNVKSCADLLEENEDIQKRTGGKSVASQIFRIGFFTKHFKTNRGLNTAKPEDFVGYLITKKDEISGLPSGTRVYESVLPICRTENNFARGESQFICQVGTKRFPVSGFLYAQQNALTNVCAHVALRSAVPQFHTDGDMSYREMNDLLGIDHQQKKVGHLPGEPGSGNGLSLADMITVIDSVGAKTEHANYPSTLSSSQIPYQRFLYGSVESGFPAMLVFKTANSSQHVVPVFGHTFNRDMWVPSAEASYFRVGPNLRYIPSDSWLSTFICHDDNWGSNFCIPRHYLRTLKQKKSTAPPGSHSNSEWVSHVIATLPKNILLTPLRAEVIGLNALYAMFPLLPNDGNRWRERLAFYARYSLTVLRTILVTGKEYADHLDKIDGWKGARIRRNEVEAFAKYPHLKFWMVELSVPELFPTNFRKVGEILFFAEKQPDPKQTFNSIVMARLPGYFVFYNGGDDTNPKFDFLPNQIESHVPLYRCEE